MARIDVRNKTIQAKLVYYGPGLCGKTTNLQWINRNVSGGKELMSLATEGDMTIFFDFMPLDVGKLRGMDVQFKLYTVPGQVRYNQTRKMVLKNVDGIVFVADSQPQMMDANLESLDNLFENIAELGMNADDVAVVLQYNKRDLPNVMLPKDLDDALNQKRFPTFLASAYTGEGVFETLKEACHLVISRLAVQIPETPPSDAAVKTASRASQGAIPAAAPVAAQPPSSSVMAVAGRNSAAMKAAAPASSASMKAAAPASTSMKAAAPASTSMKAAAPVAGAGQPLAAAAARQAAPVAAPVGAVSGGAAPSAVVHTGAHGSGVRAVATARQAAVEPSYDLEQTLASANQLMAELVRELELVRAERASGISSDALSKLSSQLVTKADVQRLLADVASKGDLAKLAEHVAPLPMLELDDVGKPSSASDSQIGKAIAELQQELSTLPQKLKPPAQNDGDVKRMLGEIAANGAQLKQLPTLVSQLIADVAQLNDNGWDIPEGKSGDDTTALSQRLEQLATKAELRALREQIAEQQGDERVVALLGEIKQQLKDLMATGSGAVPLDVATKSDLATFARQFNYLPTKSELADHVKQVVTAASVQNGGAPTTNVDFDKLRYVVTKSDLKEFAQQFANLPTKADFENLRQQAPAGGLGADVRSVLEEFLAAVKQGSPSTQSDAQAGVVTKADLAAVVARLGELPSRADLQALQERVGRPAPALDVRAVEQALAKLPSKSDLEALQAQLQELSEAVASLYSKRAAEPPKALEAAVPERPAADEATRAEPATSEGAPPIPAASAAATADSSAPVQEEAPSLPSTTDAPPAAAQEAAASGASEETAPVAQTEAEPSEPAVLPPAPDEDAANERISAAATEAETPTEGASEAVAESSATGDSAPSPAATAAEAQVLPEAPRQPEPEAAKEVDPYADDKQHQNAARIARVMVADLYLYNKDQVDNGLRSNDFWERNKEALADMRVTYESRVEESVRAARDHLQLAIESFIKKKRKQLGLEP